MSDLYELRMSVYASLLAALMAVGAYLAIPIGPVPVVLQNMFVFLAPLLLGRRWGLASVAVYLLAGACGLHDCADGHDMLVGDITVGEGTLVSIQILDQLGKVLFGIDRNTCRIELSGQFGWVSPPFNIGDLRRGKSHNVVFFVIPIVGVKVVEIPSGCANDDTMGTL